MATTKKPAVKTAKAVKETKEVKTTAVKEVAAAPTTKAEVAPAVKEEAAPKKRACKKAPATKATITVQYQGRDYTDAELIEACKADYAANGFDDAVETLDIYVQPENGVAYYSAWRQQKRTLSTDYKYSCGVVFNWLMAWCKLEFYLMGTLFWCIADDRKALYVESSEKSSCYYFTYLFDNNNTIRLGTFLL